MADSMAKLKHLICITVHSKVQLSLDVVLRWLCTMANMEDTGSDHKRSCLFFPSPLEATAGCFGNALVRY